VSSVKYELSSYIPDDDILHSHRCENLKSYIVLFQSSGEGGRPALLFPFERAKE
jgi:hypothetical protein